MSMVDIRCPVTPRRLFARLRAGDATVLPGNTIEVACDPCRKTLRNMGEDVSLVLHEFNLLGECIGTVRQK